MSTFLDHDDMLAFLNELAERVGDSTSENEYSEVTSVYFREGKALLDYVENDPGFTVDSFMDSLPGNSQDEEKRENLEYLMSNFKSMASEWRKSIDKDGNLTFYVD